MSYENNSTQFTISSNDEECSFIKLSFFSNNGTHVRKINESRSTDKKTFALPQNQHFKIELFNENGAPCGGLTDSLYFFPIEINYATVESGVPIAVPNRSQCSGQLIAAWHNNECPLLEKSTHYYTFNVCTHRDCFVKCNIMLKDDHIMTIHNVTEDFLLHFICEYRINDSDGGYSFIQKVLQSFRIVNTIGVSTNDLPTDDTSANGSVFTNNISTTKYNEESQSKDWYWYTMILLVPVLAVAIIGFVYTFKAEKCAVLRYNIIKIIKAILNGSRKSPGPKKRGKSETNPEAKNRSKEEEPVLETDSKSKGEEESLSENYKEETEESIATKNENGGEEKPAGLS